MTNLKIKTIIEFPAEAFDKAVNEFTQNPDIIVRATQTHPSNDSPHMIAVIFYEEARR